MCLAATCWRQGLYSEAEALERQVLENCLQRLGEHDDVTVDAKAALSSTLRSIGRFEESEKLQRDVLQYRIRTYGESHPGTLDSMSELGCLKMYQGHLEEAENILRIVVQKQQATLGKEHPTFLGALNALSLVLMKEEKYVETEEIQRWLLQMEKRSGKTRPSLVQSMANLAHTLFRTQKYTEASKLQQRVLKAQINSLGRHHPQTVNALLHLVDIYNAQERFAKSHRLLSTAYTEMRQFYGKDHLETLKVMHGLSKFYLQTRQFRKAAAYGRYRLRKIYEKAGIAHPNTLDSARNLLSIYRAWNHHLLALVLLLNWVQCSIQELGESDNGREEPIMELGLTLYALKRYRDAERVQLYGLERALRSPGTKIEDCSHEIKNLGRTLDSQRRHCKAKALRDSLFQHWRPQVDSKDYLSLQVDQSYTLYRIGLKVEALALLERIVDQGSMLRGDVAKVSKTARKWMKVVTLSSSRLRRRRRFRFTGAGEYV
ncbi:hypothetical protein FRC18_007772 [Serendipita sp. 400]|nr:hypothetical protein FRC18_007772 [Serendipita sp. 400]